MKKNNNKLFLTVSHVNYTCIFFLLKKNFENSLILTNIENTSIVRKSKKKERRMATKRKFPIEIGETRISTIGFGIFFGRGETTLICM